jgi:glyoxylase-like metal-dependent hydrolase (beta-lactamase superfamily II)
MAARRSAFLVVRPRTPAARTGEAFFMADIDTKQILPLLPLTTGVVLPGMVVTLTVESDDARNAVAAARAADGTLLLVPRVDGRYSRVGTVATLEDVGRLPSGVEALPGREHNDLVLWVDERNAVVCGDTLVDFGEGFQLNDQLRAGVTREQVVGGLRTLLDRPVEHVLPAHGAPTGRVALERALA